MRRARAVAVAVSIAIAIAIALVGGVAAARPGGGGGFHGGSSGGSHGGGGGGFHPGGGSHTPTFHPSPGPGSRTPSSGTPSGDGTPGGGADDGGGVAGAGLVILLGLGLFALPLVLIVALSTKSKPRPWSTAAPPTATAPSQATIGARRALEAIREHDPGFSLVLYEDFLYALYAEVHAARGRGQVALYSAYVAPAPLAMLASAQGGGVRDIIVGAMRFLPAPPDAGDGTRDRALVEFEANYTEREQSFYVKERWALGRARGVKSRTPERARIFTCPSCGAPQDAVAAGVCSYCKQQVATGTFDWLVEGIEVVERNPTPPVLTGDAPEEGTDWPTRIDPYVVACLAQLQAKDPGFDVPSFERRVGLIFSEFQAAWAGRDLARMRPYLSDALLEVETYWVQTYLRQGLRNVTENARIFRLELARVASDAYFDAITVRLFAASLDYTIRDADGGLVGGSRTAERTYSEYWTFIRGAQKKGPARGEPVCPNCGAALKINMAGVCEYCKAHVTRGDFDWVLSRIEQDEAYEG